MDQTEKDKWKVLLKRIDFFAPFEEEELDELLDLGEIQKYPLHAYIIKEEQYEKSFYVIVRGKVAIVKEDSHKQKRNIASLSEGACFGEMSVLLDGHRSANVVTAVECFLYKLEGDLIKKLNMSIQMKIYRQFSTALAEKLKDLNERMVEMI